MLSIYVATHHKDVYQAYLRHLVDLRNSGDYPFYPVDVFGPYSAQEVWDFADHTNGRLLPVTRDEEASEFVAREWQEAEEARMRRERDQS